MPATYNPTPPKGVLNYFNSKKATLSFDFRDVWREEHAVAFTVAKVMEMDVLLDIQESLTKAITEGQTLQSWKKELTPTLQKKGWWGKKTVIDPLTGKSQVAQLGSARRLKTIYKANLRSARSAAQYQRGIKNKLTHPYFLYQIGASVNHREKHLSWDRLILPVDHSFWDSHYPPNGWGCKCHGRHISQRRADQYGGVTKAPKVKNVKWTNKRTGAIENLPEGIDPGWDTNPGKTRFSQTLKKATQKINQAPAAIASNTVQALVTGATFQHWYNKPTGNFPIGVLSDSDSAKIKAKVHTVELSADTLKKQNKNHPDLSAQDYLFIQQALNKGERIQDGGQSLIYILESEGYVTVVKATKTGKAIFLTSFRRLSGKQVKKDEEIKRLRKKQNKDE